MSCFDKEPMVGRPSRLDLIFFKPQKNLSKATSIVHHMIQFDSIILWRKNRGSAKTNWHFHVSLQYFGHFLNTDFLHVVAPGEAWFEMYLPQIMPPLAPKGWLQVHIQIRESWWLSINFLGWGYKVFWTKIWYTPFKAAQSPQMTPPAHSVTPLPFPMFGCYRLV